MSYVPPILRRKQEALSPGQKLSHEPMSTSPSMTTSNDTLPSVPDIQDHFWPRKRAGTSALGASEKVDGQDTSALALRENQPSSKDSRDPSDKTTIQSASTILDSNLPHTHSTLNSTQAEPDKLKYVLLFSQAVSLTHSRDLTMLR